MSGVYWGLTAMFLMNKQDMMEKDEILEFVQSCQHDNGGFGASQNHDSHLLYTLSAIQVYTAQPKHNAWVLFVSATFLIAGCLYLNPARRKTSLWLELKTARRSVFTWVGFLYHKNFFVVNSKPGKEVGRSLKNKGAFILQIQTPQTKLSTEEYCSLWILVFLFTLLGHVSLWLYWENKCWEGSGICIQASTRRWIFCWWQVGYVNNISPWFFHELVVSGYISENDQDYVQKFRKHF